MVALFEYIEWVNAGLVDCLTGRLIAMLTGRLTDRC